jgi:hypothetical protein
MTFRTALPLVTAAALIGLGLAASQAQQAGMTFFVSSVRHMKSWNSSHGSRGCSQDQLKASGGAGLTYCFAAN